MLQSLFIKNIGLITEITVDFKSGLNILTGETGAGKSMIMGSINFLCGKKFDKINIRKDCTDAIVEGIFSTDNKNIIDIANELGIEISEDNLIIICRRYNLRKVTNRINGRSVTVGMLSHISHKLMEFYGQNETQKLFDQSRHLEILDKFCAKKILPLKKILVAKIKKLHELEKILNDLVGQSNLENKIMLLQFQINEIFQANLSLGEEENLRARYKILANAKNIYEKLAHVMNLLYHKDFSARDNISCANQILIEIQNEDVAQKNVSEFLNSILINIDEIQNEIAHSLSDYEQILQNNSDEMLQIENRLDFLYEIKTKYKKNIDKIIDYGKTLENELQKLNAGTKKIKQFENETLQTKGEIEDICEKICKLRKKSAKAICLQIQKNLADLSMPDAKIKIDVCKKNNFNETGYDDAKILIASNLGEDFKPIDKISSGGEASRIMLAIETVFADYNNIPTVIFDEIDSGVSGKAAQMVAEKLNLVSRNHQIICITHLVQIAAMADTHFLIKKISVDNSTQTQIFELDEEKVICELAEILSGKKITNITLKSAREIKNSAMITKNLQ